MNAEFMNRPPLRGSGRVGKEGRKLAVSVTISPLKDGEGRLSGTSDFFHDITARQRAEAEIRWQANELRADHEELMRFNQMTVGRELRIIEFKTQVNELCAKHGQPPQYAPEPQAETETPAPTPLRNSISESQ